MGKIGETI
nr:unnamed protein product [Callosobruchus chinensis]CAH7740781.1 unnamed protein product [Callosobruchus chinensis]CAH7748785.1 unnamed protein product [Callosobruchus chinensis]